MKLNTFKNDLAYSLSQTDDPVWEKIYRRAFSFVGMKTITDLEEQKRGRDRYVMTTSGRGYYIEEKKRRGTWPDILLEYVSVDTTNAPGWIRKDLAIDYIAYAFMDTKIGYLLPWPTLKRAWDHYGNGWLAAARAKTNGFKIIVADNGKYKTYSVAVPTERLLRAVRTAMTVTFD